MIPLINRSGRSELRHIFKEISFSLKLRHVQSNDNKRFSDIFHHIFTNTKPISPSVCIASSAVAHTKKSSCWINRKSHFISYRSYHQCSPQCCIRSNLFQEFKRSISIDHKKMVWISDLDNPKVNFHVWKITFW